MSYSINNTNIKKRSNFNNPNDTTNYGSNLSGNPKRDTRFGSYSRQASIIITDGAIVNAGQPDIPLTAEEIAADFQASGIWVGITKPREGEEEGFVPSFYTTIKLGYFPDAPEDRQPKVYLVTPGEDPLLLTEDTVGLVDTLADNGQIAYIDLDLNKSRNRKTGKYSLYINNMYVVKKTSYDPHYDKYHQKPTGGESAE